MPYSNAIIDKATLTRVLQNSNISAEEIHLGSDLGGHISIDLSSSGINSDKIGLILKALAGHTANLIEFKDSNDNDIFIVTKDGLIESGSYSSAINNSQTEQPAGNLLLTTEYYYRGESGDGWFTTRASQGSMDNPLFVYPTNDYDIEHIILKLSKIKLIMPELSFTLSGTASNTLKWYYSLDGGSTWTLGGTSANLTSSDTITAWDTTSVIVDGENISGDVKIGIGGLNDNNDGTLTLANQNMGYYQIALKS